MAKVKVFVHIGPGSLKIMVATERSCYREYACAIWKPIYSYLKILGTVNVFQRYAKVQAQDHKVKMYGTIWKV